MPVSALAKRWARVSLALALGEGWEPVWALGR